MRNISLNPLFIILLLCVLIGCTPKEGKDAQVTLPKEAPLSLTFEHFLSVENFKEGAWPDPRWWKIFADPQLDALVEKSLANHPTLKSAEAKVRKARSFARSVRSILIPQFDGLVEDNYQHLSKHDLLRTFAQNIPPVLNEVNLAINFTQEIDLWGKHLHDYRAAIFEAKKEAIEVEQAQLLLSTAVSRAYFALQSLMHKRALLEKMEIERKKREDLTTQNFIVGVDEKTDQLSKKQLSLDSRQQIIEIDEKISRAKHLLNILVAEDPGTVKNLSLSIPFFSTNFSLPNNLPLDLLSRRPDLLAQLYRVHAAAEKIKVAKREFYPNVNLIAFAGLDSLQFSTLFRSNSFNASLHPAIHLPIFTGWKLEANLREKEAEFAIAVFDYHNLVLTAAKEVADGLSSFLLLNGALDVQSDILQSAKLQFETSFDRYSAGIDSLLIALESEENLLERELKWIDLKFIRLIAIVELIQALGGGFSL